MLKFIKRTNVCRMVFSSLVLLIMTGYLHAGLGLENQIVSSYWQEGVFPLVDSDDTSILYYDSTSLSGVIRAIGDLQLDIERVTGKKPELVTSNARSKNAVIVGTVGNSKIIDSLVSSGKINIDDLKGKWECFMITTVDQPFPDIESGLVIAGSDKRGTIYGIYELSEQLGVSPWYWWADVPAKKRQTAYVTPGRYVSNEPVVKYRGIFINDEDPCLGSWAREKFGGVNSKMYAHMFELILRLRGNYLWPAMWGKAFNEDDPESPRLANEYGIVMGTSHHEPMMRAQKEWTVRSKDYGNGQWNYLTNSEGLKKFWTEGMERNRNYDNLVTMGLRGDGDMKMEGGESFEEMKKLLERIVIDQREILARVVGREVTEIPQLWAIFTEVQDYYDAGMNIPDDITLLFTDDNVGNLRRIPTAEDRKRSGGAGVYFHMDMNGGPFSYKWLNSNPLPKIWEQMNIAHKYGADRIWIVNVGDLKPLEIPLEFWMRMAWDPDAMTKEKVAQYQLRWAKREFGSTHADAISDLVSKYAKYNNWRKPELLKPDTFSFVNYREAERVSLMWSELKKKAEALNSMIPQEQQDAYYQLVLHPILACENLNELYLAAGRNAMFARQGRASANLEAVRVRELFKKDQEISDHYNNVLADGKWKHMMDQTHIGYTGWESPQNNIMPKIVELELTDTADIGVAVEGLTDVWPGSNAKAKLPPFDSINCQRYYIEVFSKGKKKLNYKICSDMDWIILSEGKAPGVGNDRRIEVAVVWDKLTDGQTEGLITVEGVNGSVEISVKAIKASAFQMQQARGCYGGLTGPIAFLAEGYSKNEPVGNARWEVIPDYGRGDSAMEVFPVTTEPIEPPMPAPCLEYPVYFAHAAKYEVLLITAPTLDMIKGMGQRIAVSIDNQPLEVVRVFNPDDPEAYKDVMPYFTKTYHKTVCDNARVTRFTQEVKTPGKHILKLTMVDPAVVVQKIIIHDGNLPESYFGPQEMSRN